MLQKCATTCTPHLLPDSRTHDSDTLALVVNMVWVDPVLMWFLLSSDIIQILSELELTKYTNRWTHVQITMMTFL